MFLAAASPCSWAGMRQRSICAVRSLYALFCEKRNSMSLSTREKRSARARARAHPPPREREREQGSPSRWSPSCILRRATDRGEPLLKRRAAFLECPGFESNFDAVRVENSENPNLRIASRIEHWINLLNLVMAVIIVGRLFRVPEDRLNARQIIIHE